MRLRLLGTAGVIVASLALMGCPPKNGECSSTDDCKGQPGYENDVCVSGKCQECGADTDCKPGFLCQANKCQPKPECSQDADCGTGKKCSAGKCAAAVSGCKTNADCPGGKCLGGSCRPMSACNADTDCGSGQTCQSGTCGEPQACQLEKVHFGFNEASLDESSQSILKNDADCIQKRRISVQVEGNADERGTEEYNLHLGERRAGSVKTYLQKLGVDAKKMKTISYGKERPVNSGHDEAAWAENRRVDLTEK